MEPLPNTATYFEEILIFAPIQKEATHENKKNYQVNWTEKFADKAKQCFAFLANKPKVKLAVEWSWFLEK